jgi:hypothetical protein
MGRPIYVKGKDSGLQPKVDAKLLHLSNEILIGTIEDL